MKGYYLNYVMSVLFQIMSCLSFNSHSTYLLTLYILSFWQLPKQQQQQQQKCCKAKYLVNTVINQIYHTFEWWGGCDVQDDRSCYEMRRNVFVGILRKRQLGDLDIDSRMMSPYSRADHNVAHAFHCCVSSQVACKGYSGWPWTAFEKIF